MAKSLVIADLPTLKEKNIRGLNTGSIRAKRQSSYSQKDIKCYHGLILVPNLSRCVGKWLIYIQIHAPHFRHALDRAQNDPHVPGAIGTLRPSGWQGEDRFLQDAERSRHRGQHRATTREGRRLSAPRLSRRAFPVRPNARSPGEQNSPFPFPWPPVRKGDGTQVSPPQVPSGRHSKGPVGPASPASRAAIGPGRRPAAGMPPREPAREKPTQPVPH